ncbi:MAG: tRNA (adenosine(37)-N6)-threonylcarbamoyltransferase complex dimerization subunit type 1 TsaB [Maricaulaceae bacterium]
MIVLGLDTTGGDCACAIVDRGRILSAKSETLGRGHAERLAPMVQECLTEAGLSPADIDRIAVCSGPGSFTGLRVALAFAVGFALPHDIPVLGVSALEVYASQIDPEGKDTFAIFTDVRRGELSYQFFERGQPIAIPQTDKTDAVHARLSNHTVHELTGSISVSVMAWRAIDLAPNDYPAAPLYSRPPDAKLPGGVTP